MSQKVDGTYEIMEVKFAQAPEPKFYERAGQGGRVDYGEDNAYPSFLSDLYRDSSKHGAIVKSKATYIYGSGLDKIKELPMANDLGETWNDVLKKVILDIILLIF